MPKKRKNGCVMLVKRFIDIPLYLKSDREAAFHKCKDTIARLLSGVLNMHTRVVEISRNDRITCWGKRKKEDACQSLIS